MIKRRQLNRAPSAEKRDSSDEDISAPKKTEECFYSWLAGDKDYYTDVLGVHLPLFGSCLLAQILDESGPFSFLFHNNNVMMMVT